MYRAIYQKDYDNKFYLYCVLTIAYIAEFDISLEAFQDPKEFLILDTDDLDALDEVLEQFRRH